MSFKHLASLALGFGLSALVGCGDKPAPSATTPTTVKVETHADKDKHKDGDDHDHGPGPHKGTIGEWGTKHFEFTVDHDTQEANVYILKGNVKDTSPIKADKVKLTIKEPKFSLDLKAVPDAKDPAGSSSKFVGKDARFGKKQEFAGTLEGMDGTKPYTGDFAEKPEKK